MQDALIDLRDFYKTIPKADAFIMDETFKKELKSFGLDLFASELTDENEIAAAEQAKDAMVSNKSSIFNKTITVYAAGIAVRMEADKFFESIHADKGYATTLLEIAGQVDSCQDPQEKGLRRDQGWCSDRRAHASRGMGH